MKVYQVYHDYVFEDYGGYETCYVPGRDPVGPLFESREDAEIFVKKYENPHKDRDGCPVGRLEIQEMDFVPPGAEYSVDEEAFYWLNDEDEEAREIEFED